MITLFGMPSAGGLKHLSPYVVKVEMALRYLNAEYKIQSVDPWKIGKLSPNGKVPWIKVDNVEIGESDVIIEHLVKVYKSDLLALLVALPLPRVNTIPKSVEVPVLPSPILINLS